MEVHELVLAGRELGRQHTSLFLLGHEVRLGDELEERRVDEATMFVQVAAIEHGAFVVERNTGVLGAGRPSHADHDMTDILPSVVVFQVETTQ
ncbi:hypothetical protein D3C78_1432970 [compost metagenome]